MMRKLLLIFVLLASVGAARASNQGGTESPFGFGAGARDLSLGGAGLAVCDAATAPFWNAARLARAERFSLSGFYSNLYESDVMYQYFGLALPTVDFGSFGLGIFRLGIKGIEKRDAGDLYLGDIDDNRLALYLAYARTFSNYDLGLAVMLEHHSLDDYAATSSPGINLSAGRRFELNYARLKYVAAAVDARNILKPRIELVEESVDYPLTLNLGVTAGLTPHPNWNQSLILSVGLSKVDYLDPALSAGVEYDFEDVLKIRGGLRGGKMSFGAGLNYKILAFDYALIDRDLGSLHTFSLTTSFGLPASEKRQNRIRKREGEFNQLMQDRLTTLNREKVAGLTKAGQEALEAGDLNEAANSFDRALFLARSSNLDTTAINDLVLETQGRIDEVLRLQRYRQYLDSAVIRVEAGDFLGARYFAAMARTEEPNSQEAAEIQKQADEAIRQVASREEMINSRLWIADSLLNYGLIEQALTVLTALSEYAAENDQVRMALRKTAFERWRAVASSAYSNEKFDDALSALDSALVLYPNHEWCLNLKDRIGKEVKIKAVKPAVEIAATPEPLSPELLNEVSEAYNAGRELFTKGELPEAIKYWEKVERLAPGYSSVRSYLVNAYKFVGIDMYSRSRFDEAVGVWKKAAVLDPDNEEINGFIRRTETEIRKLQELSYDQK